MPGIGAVSRPAVAGLRRLRQRIDVARASSRRREKCAASPSMRGARAPRAAVERIIALPIVPAQRSAAAACPRIPAASRQRSVHRHVQRRLRRVEGSGNAAAPRQVHPPAIGARPRVAGTGTERGSDSTSASAAAASARRSRPAAAQETARRGCARSGRCRGRPRRTAGFPPGAEEGDIGRQPDHLVSASARAIAPARPRGRGPRR